MSSDRHLDKKRAVENFAHGFKQLASLPFIADAEIAGLLGAEVAAALQELASFNRQENLCRDCSNRCCNLVGCEFYSAELGLCPVQTYRPLLCRIHFCHRFAGQYPLLVKDLGDIFLDGLQAAARLDSQTADFFDCPAFLPLVPSLVAGVLPLLAAVKAGRLAETAAFDLIEKAITGYYGQNTTAV